MAEHNVYRDGKVHVLNRKCSTCVFGPRRPVDQERVDGMVADADRNESTIVCHSTLYTDGVDNAACRGYFDLRSSVSLRMADALGVVEFVPDPKPSGTI